MDLKNGYRNTYNVGPGSSTVDKSEELTKEEWIEKIRGLRMQRADMNRLIMNYLVTEGFKGAAERFRIESGVQPSVDLDTLDERIKIRDAIQNGKIQEAIEMVNNLHPELLDCDRYLFFHLQQQHLIELIRERNIEEALKYAQEQLAERGEENREVLSELERTLALLAFDEPERSPFGDLLHPSHRQEIASEVNASILEMENRDSTTPKIATLMRVMLWIQEELEKKKVKYPKMTDIANGIIEEPK
ncbi:UNVERIFIED_CONTAM: Glucose-induced degradation protein 8-like protein [Trichonephila clavipes]